MTDIRTIRQKNTGIEGTIDVTYWTKYRYDEAGNRIRKQTWQYTGSEPDPVFEGDNPLWQLMSDEF